MFAIRIEDIIEDKDLVIPFEKLKLLNHKDVEVIILAKQHQESNKKYKISDILAKYKNINPFDKIKNASEWQRDLRNEW